MLFSPPWAVLVLQNRQNVCFPSKGWLSWRTGSISQETLRQQSATACSCGGRSQITQACCCSCLPSTSSAVDSTGEVWGLTLSTLNLWRCREYWHSSDFQCTPVVWGASGNPATEIFCVLPLYPHNSFQSGGGVCTHALQVSW